VLWITVLLTAVTFELTRRARQERLAALNVIDDVVLTAALDASVDRTRSVLNVQLMRVAARLPGERDNSRSDPWHDVTASSPDTFRLPNVRVVMSMSDVAAKLNINLADTTQIALLLSALGADAAEARRVAMTLCARRDGRAARAFKSVGEVVDFADGGAIPSELWRTLAPLLTVLGSGRVNLRTAPAPILMTLPGFTDEAAQAVYEIRSVGARLAALDDLLPRLSFSARATIMAARPILDQRVSFETVDVEVRSQALTVGGLYGESIALVRRNDRELTAVAVRLQ
jgi:hypothetical protein